MLKHAQEVMGIPKLAAITSAENYVSMAVLRKIGFTYQGMIQLPGIEHGTTRWCDADGDVLSAAERSTIDALMEALRQQRGADEAATIEAATQALAKGTEAFAAQRMNRGIQQALAGKNVQSL